MEWLLLSLVAVALHWIADQLTNAILESRWRRRAMPSSASEVHDWHSWQFALAVTILVFVLLMQMVFVMGAVREEGSFNDVVYLGAFGALTGYLWMIVRERWRAL
jgi:arginine exporter protein ArgO